MPFDIQLGQGPLLQYLTFKYKMHQETSQNQLTNLHYI